MTSILTNTGAMVALQALNATQSALTNTQNQISTGLAISTSKDNASTWTVATTMKANVASLNQVSTDLGNADSVLGTAVSGTTQIMSLVSQIRAQAASMTDTSTNTTATGAKITQLANQIQATIASSSFNGVNLLDSTNAGGLTFEANTNNDYNQTAQATSTTISTGAIVDLSTSGSATATSTFNALMTTLGTGAALTAGPGNTGNSLDTALAGIDAYSAQVETSSSTLGSVQANVEGQQTFVNNLATQFTSGAGAMVDANMTAESARLTALQTQQSLGVSALSIANQAPQAILKLFG